jgi:hypothetical protein
MTKREQLLDRMIRIYGFEHPLVLELGEMIEDPYYRTDILETIVKCHEAHPQLNLEDEEE